MRRKNATWSVRDCLISRAIEEIGDRWTLLILRDLMTGPKRFNQIQENLGIARNLLAERLRRMQGSALVQRDEIDGEPHRHAYRLTEKGIDLQTVIVALNQWGARWLADRKGKPIVFFDAETGAEVEKLAYCSEDGSPVDPSSLVFQATPAAPPEMQERYKDPIPFDGGVSRAKAAVKSGR